MSRNFALALGAFGAIVALAFAAGLARDFCSREVRVLSGIVDHIDAGGQAHKSPVLKSPNLRVTLDDGRSVDVSARSVAALQSGNRVEIIEFAMPWGQLWYKLQAK